MSVAFEDADALLIACGAKTVAHPGGTLYEHLHRVRALLAEWEAPNDVQLAGLCHAFYGTDAFPSALLPLDQRATLVDAIGLRAESLVHLYAGCERDEVYPRLHEHRVEFRDRFTNTHRIPDEESLNAFVEITAANELDVVRHNRALALEHGKALLELFSGCRAHLSSAAWRAWKNEPLPQ